MVINKKIKINDFLIVIFITLSLWTSSMGIIYVTWYLQYLLAILCIVIICINKYKFYLIKKEINLILIFFIPQLCIYLYTFLISILKRNIENIDSFSIFTRASGFFLYALIAIIVAIVVNKMGKNDIISILYTGFLINYSICILLSICRNGLLNTLKNIFNYNVISVGNILEAHEVGLTMPLFLFYFLMSDVKYRNIKIISCIIVVFMTQKRIVYGTVILVLVFYFMLRKVDKKKKFLTITTIGLFVACYLWIYILRSELFWKFIDKHWINMMSRQYIWKGLENIYYFSPFFVGNGSGYTARWLAKNTFKIIPSASGIVGAIHNDILRMYIEYGFIGFGLYLYNFFILNTKRIYRWFSEQEGMLYLLLIIIQVLLWTTDNVSTYFNFQIVFYTIVFRFPNNNLQNSSSDILLKGVNFDD